MTQAPAVLHVCITCRAGREPTDGVALPGAALHARLASLLEAQDEAMFRLAEVKCLSNCARGCAAAIAMAGKWSYLLGGLSLDDASDLLTYAATYAASANGTVLPSRRPRSLATMVDGRIPAAERRDVSITIR